MRYLAYLRVSTEDQAESGAGLAAQLGACQAWANRTKGELSDVFADEGVSGAKGLDQRPALLDAVGSLSKGDVLVVAKRDRLGRDPIHVAMIEQAVARKGARIMSAAGEGTEGDDPASVLMRRMIDAFAEYERLIIGARTKIALQAMKNRGQRIGAIPYGYQLASDGLHLEEHPEEQAVISAVQRLKDNGLSLRNIADRLSQRGVLSRTGKVFAAAQIQRKLAA